MADDILFLRSILLRVEKRSLQMASALHFESSGPGPRLPCFVFYSYSAFSTYKYKFAPANWKGNITKCTGVTCCPRLDVMC